MLSIQFHDINASLVRWLVARAHAGAQPREGAGHKARAAAEALYRWTAGSEEFDNIKILGPSYSLDRPLSYRSDIYMYRHPRHTYPCVLGSIDV